MEKIIFNVSISVAIIALCCYSSQCKPLDINTKEDINSKEDINGEYNGNLDKKTIDQLRKCDMDMATMELCMRCAKITKSTIVYPLCCANEDNIKGWCHDYVFFGAM